VGAASLVLAGCGGGGGGGGTTPGAAPTGDSAAPECEVPQAQPTGSPSTAPLKIGSLLPETGSLAFLGPPEFAGVDLAIVEINENGGVLGQEVGHVRGDSGDDTTDIANQTVDRQLGSGVQAIVGAAASGVSKLVIDKITGAGVVQFSPANTSDEFTCWQDKGLYFRTAPPDALQAQALANVIAGDGNQRVSILVRNDPYGTGLADNLEQNLLAAGIPQDSIQKIVYDPNAASFNVEVDQVAQFNPDGIAVIGFDESKRIITRMSELQIGPAQKRVYGSDGNMGNALGEGMAPGILQGMQGTLPLTDLAPDFEQRLLTQDDGLVDFNYAGESYDATMLIALAAEKAKSTNGADIGSEIIGITKDGEKCTTFAACKAIIDKGGDPDYDGVTGTLNFTPSGEPGAGSYGVQVFNAENKIDEGATRYVIVGETT
jgi:branched-chain amino acid transport system substrate-binding protein